MASYIATTQSARTTDFYSLSSSLNSAKDCLLHCPPKSDTAPKLVGYRPGYQIGVKFRLLNLPDIQLNLLPYKVLKEESHFINSLSSPPDYDARASSINSYRHLIRLAFNIRSRNS